MGADIPLVKKKYERNLMQMRIKDKRKIGYRRRERSTATKNCKVQTHNWNMECEDTVGDRAAGAAEKRNESLSI